MSLVSLFRMQPCVGFTRSGLKLWGNSSVYVKVLSFSETTHLQHYRLQSTKTGGRMAFLYSGRCTSQARLDGKTAIITGCNTGIGKVNVVDFLKRDMRLIVHLDRTVLRKNSNKMIGCRVIMACRDLARAEQAVGDIKKEVGDISNGKIVVKHLDLASLASVRSCAKEILEEEQRIDILVNNAGVMLCPKTETSDGFELQMGTNHLGHFLFTLLLLPRIIQSAPARIINVSSVGHKNGTNNFEDINWKKTPYNALVAYGQSKLANIHFTTELSRRLQGKGVSVYAVHPGWVRTELGRHLDSLYFRGFRRMLSILIGGFMKSPEQGAQTQIYCAVDEKAGNETGLYYADCRAVQPHAVARDQEASARLWDLSVQLVGYSGDLFSPNEK